MSVALKKSPFGGVSPAELAQQLAGHQKAQKKLPSWFGCPGIYYPPALNLEQCSSEKTGLYKAALTGGKMLVDLTGGYGVDSYFFARQFEQVHYCEIDPDLAEIAAHNFQVLGAGNIEVHAQSGLDVLAALREKRERPTWVYADPARRSVSGGRVIRLEEYQPDIPAHLNSLLEATDNLLVKTSPMLDLAAGTRSLHSLREIHVVAVANEVRELLWWMQPGYNGPCTRVALDLEGGEPLHFTPEEEAAANTAVSLPLAYLYEPNAALMKAAPFGLLGERYGLGKLHRHTHLYTSDTLRPFPGRRFKIVEVLPYKAGKLPFTKANIATRNFPESVERIRQRTRIKPGGSTYLFFVKTADETLKVLVTEAV